MEATWKQHLGRLKWWLLDTVVKYWMNWIWACIHQYALHPNTCCVESSAHVSRQEGLSDLHCLVQFFMYIHIHFRLSGSRTSSRTFSNVRRCHHFAHLKAFCLSVEKMVNGQMRQLQPLLGWPMASLWWWRLVKFLAQHNILRLIHAVKLMGVWGANYLVCHNNGINTRVSLNLRYMLMLVLYGW